MWWILGIAALWIVVEYWRSRVPSGWYVGAPIASRHPMTEALPFFVIETRESGARLLVFKHLLEPGMFDVWNNGAVLERVRYKPSDFKLWAPAPLNTIIKGLPPSGAPGEWTIFNKNSTIDRAIWRNNRWRSVVDGRKFSSVYGHRFYAPDPIPGKKMTYILPWQRKIFSSTWVKFVKP